MKFFTKVLTSSSLRSERQPSIFLPQTKFMRLLFNLLTKRKLRKKICKDLLSCTKENAIDGIDACARLK